METNDINNIATIDVNNVSNSSEEESTPLAETLESSDYKQLSDDAIDALLSTGKRMKICGIIAACVFIISICTISILTIIQDHITLQQSASLFFAFEAIFLGPILLIIAAISSFFLYKAGTNITRAINNEESLKAGLIWQKRYWIFISIISIIIALIYLFLFILFIR